MLESAEIGHRVDKKVYSREEPRLREALLLAQFELSKSRRGPVLVIVSGVDGLIPVIAPAELDDVEAGSADATESAFWRAMLRADPRNPAFEPGEARRSIEAYLAAPNPRRRTEAGVMLRMLDLADSLRAVQAAQRSSAEARDRARDEEVQKLRDDLQRTQAELDRIKKRLGSPKP